MGSKRAMLANGLGEAIRSEARHVERVVDLFTGSATVAWFAAEHTRRPVLAVDLQHYGAVLAGAVVRRTRPLDPTELEASWIDIAKKEALADLEWDVAAALATGPLSVARVLAARTFCEAAPRGPIWDAYGGHYFSPAQALVLDALVRLAPEDEPRRSLCLSAVIDAASGCAAAPGHTAQPFQPTTRRGLDSIAQAWGVDPVTKVKASLHSLARRHARSTGDAIVADALEVAASLGPGDLVVCDPPYSDVQYSRFYHVFETIARGCSGPPEGVGRTPPLAERPLSAFSMRERSTLAFEQLFDALADAGCRVLVTFPAGDCRNGMSGGAVVALARQRFNVSSETVAGAFSTLGGNGVNRAARQPSAELLARLRPKRDEARRVRWIDVAAEVLEATGTDMASSEIVAWAEAHGCARPITGRTPDRTVNRDLHQAIAAGDPRFAKGARRGTFRRATPTDLRSRRARAIARRERRSSLQTEVAAPETPPGVPEGDDPLDAAAG